MSKGPLVSLDPPEALLFSLISGDSPKVILHITNISSSKLIFKVKTTQPSWYFVRPNQQLLDLNEAEDVVISLVSSECNRFIGMPQDEKEAVLSKHRFLVQTKSISDETFTRISSLSLNERADEYQNIWETAEKEELKNHKLRVEFNISENQADISSSLPVTPSDNTKSRFVNVDTSTSSRSSHPFEGERERIGEVPGSPDTIYAELQSLRKKYDAVVEYTVHLTAERDYHFTQLEDLKKEIIKEKSKKKVLSSTTPTNGEGKKDKSDKVVIQQGFSFVVVAIIAIISFLLARYSK